MSNLPITERTIQRNTGVFTLARAYGQTVDFTYTDDEGKVTKRKGYTVTSVVKTGRAPGRAVIKALSPSGAERSFRNDRVIRAVKRR